MVSILLSVYNRQKEVHQTLQSIFDQTYRDWEAIVVDDGSTDATMRILENAQREHPDQIKILHNAKNIGLTRSLIRAAEHAHGEYIARIDAGDVFAATKLKRQVQFLQERPDYGMVGCGYRNVYLPSMRTVIVNPPSTDAEIRKRLLRKNPFAHSCVLLRTSTYNTAGGYDLRISYGQDYDLWFRILRVAKAANLPDVLCDRTMDDRSISFRKQREQMWQMMKTQWRYMNRWNILLYWYFLEPLGMILLPGKIRERFRARTP